MTDNDKKKEKKEKVIKEVSFLGYKVEFEIKKIIKPPKPVKVKPIRPPKTVIIREKTQKAKRDLKLTLASETKKIKNTTNRLNLFLVSSINRVNSFLAKKKKRKDVSYKIDLNVLDGEVAESKFVLKNFKAINSEKDEQPSFMTKLVEKSTYEKMKTMNTSETFIKKWQRKRVFLSVGVVLLSLFMVIAFKTNPRVVPAAFLVGLIIYFLKKLSVNRYYTAYKFNRNLEFSKFARLVVPYLRQAQKGASIYYIFSQMSGRLENPLDRQLLQKLMLEITDHPNDIKPYIDFAEKMSGTDFSITFMTLIYDIAQGATDDSIVDELGKEVSAQLMDVIRDIVEFKQKRFNLFPSAIVAPNMILILGYMVCVMIYQFAQLRF